MPYKYKEDEQERNRRRRRNPDYIEYQRQYRLSHRKKLNEQAKLFYYANREAQMVYKREAIARRRKIIREGLYGHLVEAQKGLCALCGRPETATRNGKLKDLAIDHDHMTGQVRELLCQRCNTALGMADDNIEVLSNMIDYLIKHSIEARRFEPYIVKNEGDTDVV